MDHLAAKAAALADPVTLLIYADIITSTSRARRVDDLGHAPTSGIAYLTSHGLLRRTKLAEAQIADALRRLAATGLVELRGDPTCPTADFRVVESAWTGGHPSPNNESEQFKRPQETFPARSATPPGEVTSAQRSS